MIPIAVCGAHLRGLPLNHQLTGIGATFLREDRTAPCYRIFVLEDGPVPKPGLLRTAPGDPAGGSIAVEVWELPDDAFGRFVAAIPSPLGIGKIALADGSEIPGFLCEPFATRGAEEITHLGGWRAFLDC
jgi:allophanate hydrolase